MKKTLLFTLLASLLFILGACANSTDEAQQGDKGTENKASSTNENNKTNTNKQDMVGMDHSGMNHVGSGDIPEGLKEAENPKYPVGSQAIIQSDHMAGMKDANATIVGAYDTTVYTVSYSPSTGGEKVEDHKWVIHEELINPGEAPLKPGAEAKTEASHMEGMAGTTLEIDSAEQTTVYMVDFTTTDGEKVTNHQWVTENELSPAE